MREVHLAKEKASPACLHLLNEIEALKKSRGVVYHAFCEKEGVKYHLITTSKKIQLEVGRMPLHTQERFCQVLQELFENQAEDSLLLSFKKSGEQDDDSRGAILVMESSLSTERGRVYQLSPA